MLKIWTLESHTRPVTVNQMYGNATRGRRYLTSIGALFKAFMRAELLGKIPTEPHKPDMVTLLLNPSLKGDIDNYVKSVLDVLVACKVIEDDRNVKTLLVSKTDLPKEILFVVSIWSIDEEERSTFTRNFLH